MKKWQLQTWEKTKIPLILSLAASLEVPLNNARNAEQIELQARLLIGLASILGSFTALWLVLRRAEPQSALVIPETEEHIASLFLEMGNLVRNTSAQLKTVNFTLAALPTFTSDQALLLEWSGETIELLDMIE